MFDALKHINFTTRNGDKVYFDENGDSIAKYDLMNWQMREDGSVDIVRIGEFDDSYPEGKKLKFNDVKIVWSGYNNAVIVKQCCLILKSNN